MIDDCTNCEFILGPCSGSLFIRDCSDLCVTAACMQLRLRDVNNADFFVHTETDPAVESSTFVTLRPLNMLQPNLANAFAEAKLKADENRFKHAADFNTFSDPKAKVGFTLPEWLGHLMMRSLDLEGHGVCNAPEGVAEMLAGAIEGGESLEKGNCFAMGVSAKEAMRQHEVRQGLRDEDDVSDDAGDKDSQSDSLTLDSDMVSGKSSKRGADPEPTPTPVTKPPAPSPEQPTNLRAETVTSPTKDTPPLGTPQYARHALLTLRRAATSEVCSCHMHHIHIIHTPHHRKYASPHPQRRKRSLQHFHRTKHGYAKHRCSPTFQHPTQRLRQ